MKDIYIVASDHTVSLEIELCQRPLHPRKHPTHTVSLEIELCQRPLHPRKHPTHTVSLEIELCQRPLHPRKHPTHTVSLEIELCQRPLHPRKHPTHSVSVVWSPRGSGKDSNKPRSHKEMFDPLCAKYEELVEGDKEGYNERRGPKGVQACRDNV